MRSRLSYWLFAVVGSSAVAPAVHAQTWTADLYAGGTRYQALVDRVSTTNAIATLRYQSRQERRAYISLAAPLDGDASMWSATGAAARLQRYTVSGFNYGVDLAVDGYAFRDPIAEDVRGGVSGHGLPFLALARGLGTLELRGGWHQHAFSYADTSGSRGLLEIGTRGTTAVGAIGVQVDARWLRASEADYPYAGVQVATARSFGRVWAWGGKWFADELDDAVWGVGGSVTIPRAGELWLSMRQDAADPLFQSTGRRSWNIGFSRQLGGARVAPPALLPKLTPGAVQLRLPLSAVAGANGEVPSVAGEFNDWKPAPMRRNNGEWVLDLPLAAGVYRFSFVTAAGDWFVPEHYPGRIDDGMGGHVVVIVVS